MNQSIDSRSNLALMEEFYHQWKADPTSVEPSWAAFFSGFELGLKRSEASEGECGPQSKVASLIERYRSLGHLQANLDPLSDPPSPIPQLKLESVGLTEADLDQVFDATTIHGLSTLKLRDLIDTLKQTYCGTIGFEFAHIQDEEVRNWLCHRIEPLASRAKPSPERKRQVFRKLRHAEQFEKFLATKFQGAKRFGLEGGESLIPILDVFVQRGPAAGVREFVFGMAHRGRLNVLTNILGKPFEQVFAEFEDHFIDGEGDGDGDVKYHLGFSSDLVIDGKKLHLSLTPNPSHLEAVNPVVEGRVRAKQEIYGDSERKWGVPILIHGDAAFPGQGQVAETLNFSQLEGYCTGGTLHVVINNQVGFTTSPSDARSTTYCTEVAKIIQAPILHVNGDDPEAGVFAADLALEFRQKFGRDIVIDVICYRKNGHNETDEPAYTQPLMYAKIRSMPVTSSTYAEKLAKEAVLSKEQVAEVDSEFNVVLEKSLAAMRSSPKRKRGMDRLKGRWYGFSSGHTEEQVVTAVSLEKLQKVNAALTHLPAGFETHPNIKRTVIDRQRATFENNDLLDWGHAELLTYGSLLADKTPIRLSGQDCRRGTFTHRHAALTNIKTGERYVPLNHISAEQGRFQVYDSPLSEYSILGFEFGYSLDDPKSLVIWEAQFGDFCNGAQIIIDQFIASSESKWQRNSGLVMLLPHGYEGQGPEHSSARLERFLQLCADDNIQVANSTTPAQHFHLLRRQMKRSVRKPLVIMSPKSLLRHPLARSPISDLTHGSYREVLDDPKADPARVRRVILCSGKIYYDFLFDAKAEKDKQMRLQPAEVAIVRIEQLYPFPAEQIAALAKKYSRATEWVWAQEEPQNMGPWTFVEPRLRAIAEISNVSYAGRHSSASPATGSYKIHDKQQKELIEAALHGSVPHIVGGTGLEKFAAAKAAVASRPATART